VVPHSARPLPRPESQVSRNPAGSYQSRSAKSHPGESRVKVYVFFVVVENLVFIAIRLSILFNSRGSVSSVAANFLPSRTTEFIVTQETFGRTFLF
jgi:hypothetical protein